VDTHEFVKRLGFTADLPAKVAISKPIPCDDVKVAAGQFKAAGVAMRCDWSDVPLPTDAREGRDFYRCDDDQSKVIFAAAFGKLKAQAEGQTLSKAKLKELYGQSCIENRQHVYDESFKRALAVQQFSVNVKEAGLKGEVVMKLREVTLPGLFFMDDQRQVSYKLPLYAYVIQDHGKGISRLSKKAGSLYGVVFEADAQSELPKADEYCIAYWNIMKEKPPLCESAMWRWCSLEERTQSDMVYWVVGRADSLGADSTAYKLRDLFWLEPKKNRNERCLSLMRGEQERYHRISLPKESVMALIAEFGKDFLLQNTFPGFKVMQEGGEVIVRPL
jgi:hypothetical protein